MRGGNGCETMDEECRVCWLGAEDERDSGSARSREAALDAMLEAGSSSNSSWLTRRSAYLIIVHTISVEHIA